MNRLFEIILYLHDHQKVTSNQLAEHFEVSKRTILRDLDKLLVAGIPVETAQGYQGGISIDPSYQLSFSFMDAKEKDALVAGLQALDSVSAKSMTPFVMKKLFQDATYQPPLIDIDLASWQGTSLINKIELIKGCINQQCKLTFMYYAPNKASKKVVSPYQLVFYWGNWYLRAICDEADDFRLYKLNRMVEPTLVNEQAIRRVYHHQPFNVTEDAKLLVAKFDASLKAALIDDYGIDSFTEEDGYLLFKQTYVTESHMLSWLLGFGNLVKVLEPLSLRNKIKELIERMQSIYQNESE